jgi:TIR domain
MTAFTPTPAGRIFISYRREETAYPAGWLFDRLADHFGAGQIFKDVDSIQLGDDFVEVITAAVGSCDVLLALIGDQWLTITDERGRRRLDNAHDFVRLEIEAALKRKVRVIPVLVAGAPMPRADELPPSLAKLVRRQALELSPSRFDFDTGRLLKVLDRTLAEVSARAAATGPDVAVPVVPPEHDAGTHRGSVPAKTREDAGPPSAPAAERSEPSRADAREAPEDREHPSWDRSPGIPLVGSAPPKARTPSDAGKPPDRQRRRIPARAAVFAGAGAGIVLIVVLIVLLTSSHSTPPPAGAANPASSPPVIFQDSFSSMASGWDDAGGQRAGGHYKNGAYRIYAKSGGDVQSGAPEKVSNLVPLAPPNLSIEVTARRIAGSAQGDQYGIACRADNDKGYAFIVEDNAVAIAKVTNARADAETLDSANASAVHANATNRLRAVCTSVQGQHAVHLTFWVNGKKVADVTDTKNPITSGTVGLFAATTSDTTTPVEAEFDNFAVSQL